MNTVEEDSSLIVDLKSLTAQSCEKAYESIKSQRVKRLVRKSIHRKKYYIKINTYDE